MCAHIGCAVCISVFGNGGHYSGLCFGDRFSAFCSEFGVLSALLLAVRVIVRFVHSVQSEACLG